MTRHCNDATTMTWWRCDDAMTKMTRGGMLHSDFRPLAKMPKVFCSTYSWCSPHSDDCDATTTMTMMTTTIKQRHNNHRDDHDATITTTTTTTMTMTTTTTTTTTTQQQ